MRVEILHHKNRGSWQYFPAFLDRVRAFVNTYDSDMKLDLLEQVMRMSFVSDVPTMLMFVGLDDDGIVFGHCLAMNENWMGNPVTTVVQLEADQIVPQEVWADGMQAIRTFSAFHRATYIQLAARSRAVARLFRKYGFEETRVLMRQPVEGRAPLPTS